MKKLLFAFLFTLAIPAKAQVFDIDGTATVHYSGSAVSPVGVGTYFTRERGWGTKLSFRSFIRDDTKLSSGIAVLAPGLSESSRKKGVRSKQKELLLGATRTRLPFTVYAEAGATFSKNYQSAGTDGKTFWIRHPEGYRTVHPTVEVGLALRLTEHVSVLSGYNYTKGKVPVNHEITFGVGYTDFPSDWELF